MQLKGFLWEASMLPRARTRRYTSGHAIKLQRHLLSADCIMICIVGMRTLGEQEFANCFQHASYRPCLCVSVMTPCLGSLAAPVSGCILNIVLGTPLLDLSLQAEMRTKGDDILKFCPSQWIMHATCAQNPSLKGDLTRSSKGKLEP